MKDIINISTVQNRLLNMAVNIRDILENHGIEYMITFGTLLGAVRHRGFIPWDDDFDFFLFDESYDEAIKILRGSLPDDLFVEDAESEPLYFHSWAHVKDLNSIAICEQFPQDNIYQHKGLSIDLYRAIRMDERDIDLFRLQQNLLYQERKKKAGVLSEADYQTMVHSIEKDIISEKQKIKDFPSMGDAFGMVVKERIMYINEVLPLKKYDFAGEQFYGPGNANAVLTRFFGNYMELPPEEKRDSHYSHVTFL